MVKWQRIVTQDISREMILREGPEKDRAVKPILPQQVKQRQQSKSQIRREGVAESPRTLKADLERTGKQMPDEPGQRETLKARNKRSAELQKQGYSRRHSDQVAKRELPTTREKESAKREANKRKLGEM